MNLVRSHAAGVGEPLPVRAVRAAMALRANVLAKGYSGIRAETLDALLALLNAGVHPVVPSRGSVGASGDLAPLAHIALALVGEGEVWDGAVRRPGREALARAGLAPVRSAAKEGLALINGTQASTAVLALAVAAAGAAGARRRHHRGADHRRAARLDRARSTPRIHAARPYPGQQRSADNLRRLVDGQPAQPLARQLRPGAGRLFAALRAAGARRGPRRPRATSAGVVAIEANAATDNPMVFADDGEMRVGRQLPRRAGGAGRRRAGHRRGAAGDDQRAAVRAAGQPGAERPAGVPHPARRPRLGADDGAGHRRGAHLRAQDARASGERRHDPDLRQPGGPRQHEHARGAQGRARRGARHARARHRAGLRLPGDRSARAAHLVGAADAGARARADAVPALAADRPPAPDIDARRALDRRRRGRVRVRRRCQLISDLAISKFGLTTRRRLLSVYTSFAPPRATRLMTTAVRIDSRAPRHDAQLQGLAAGSGAAHADEQPRSRGGRAPRGPRRLRRHGPCRAQLGGVRRDRRARCARSTTTRRCWSSRASRSASSARTPTRRACSSPTPTSCRRGRPGRRSAISRIAA